MKKKTIILILTFIIIIAIVGTVGVVLFLNNKDDDEVEDKKEKLEWGDVYLEVLNGDGFKDLNDIEIQLCDLDKDETPELIVYGLKDIEQYLANIYKINEDNKVDTIKVDLQEKFDMEYLYNVKEEKYSWYAVTENDEPEGKNVYDLNIESEEYTPTKVDGNYSDDFVQVDENVSPRVPFDKDAEKSEKKDAFNQAKDNFVPTKEMVTEKVEEKVENAKMLVSIEKIDSSKPLVYSGLEIKETKDHFDYRYPVININSRRCKRN